MICPLSVYPLFPYTTLFRSLGDETDLAVCLVPGHEADFGRIADVNAGQIALGDFDHRKHRIERDDLGDFPPLERSEEHTSELQSLRHLVCRLLLEKKKHKQI